MQAVRQRGRGHHGRAERFKTEVEGASSGDELLPYRVSDEEPIGEALEQKGPDAAAEAADLRYREDGGK